MLRCAGVINLVTTGVITRKLGVRAAMVSQTAWPVARILAQLWAIVHNGRGSVAVLTWTQLLTMGGGGAGYSLTANTYANELVTAEERTQAFGVLSGIMMLGNSAGLFCLFLSFPLLHSPTFSKFSFLTVGGILGAKVHPAAPFLAATVLLSVSTILSGCFLPYIPPAPVDAKKGGLFAPIRPFAPRGGWWGLPLLASGTFLAAFATSFLPLLLQLHGTQSYHFEADTVRLFFLLLTLPPSNLCYARGPPVFTYRSSRAQNGYLMTLTALSRAFFLTLLFPRIISSGRSWYSTSPSSSAATSSSSSAATAPVNAKSSSASSAQTEDAAATAPPLPTSFAEMEDAGAAGIEHAGEPALATPEPTTEAKGRGFDLVFLRGSIFVDACLTALLPFAFEGWHLFVAGGLLPLASGTAPAAKGVVLEMVPKEEESDALQGIALLECLAMMTTISLSGFVFSFLTSKGTPGYTFFVNAVRPLFLFFSLPFPSPFFSPPALPDHFSSILSFQN